MILIIGVSIWKNNSGPYFMLCPNIMITIILVGPHNKTCAKEPAVFFSGVASGTHGLVNNFPCVLMQALLYKFLGSQKDQTKPKPKEAGGRPTEKRFFCG